MHRAIPAAAALVALTFAAPAHAAQQVSGQCTFEGSTMLDGTLTLVWGGEISATSTTPGDIALETHIYCTLLSPTQGIPGEPTARQASADTDCPTSACATASTVSQWPLRPVQVCTDGYAVFGSGTRTIPHSCKTSTL